MTGTLAVVIVLVLAGLALMGVNGRKLIEDWPRLKPVHNVDLAWIQFYLGLACVVVAVVLITDPARKLYDPIAYPKAAGSGDASADPAPARK